MKRERNFDGAWGYCRTCGHKAYEADGPYSICAHSCGYIQTFKDLVYQPKNTLKFDKPKNTLKVDDWDNDEFHYDFWGKEE